MSALLAAEKTQGRSASPYGGTPFDPSLLFLGFIVQIALVAGLMLILIGTQSAGVAGALIVGAVAAVLANALGEGGRGPLMAQLTLAAAAAAAAVLTGGLDSPLTPWSLLPLAAGLWLGAPLLDGVALSLAALILTAAGGYFFPTLRPIGWSGLALALEGAGPVILAIGLGGAAMSTRRFAPAPLSAHPTAAVDPAAVQDLKRQIGDLSAARTEAEAESQRIAESLRTRSRFLASMSHELRTPLNAIMGFSDIMRVRMFGDLSPKYLEYAELIHESGRHLLDLINDVLDMSKIEAERFHLDLRRFDAREAVAAALRLTSVQAREVGVQVHEVLQSSPLDVLADERALKQIVLNLVSKALKFTPGGGEVSVTAEAVGENFVLAVVDTGVGIAKEDLARLGRPFEQAGGAESRARGTGLGLSLVRALAELHGGTLEIESALGEGTAVTVRLPVLDKDRTALPPGPLKV